MPVLLLAAYATGIAMVVALGPPQDTAALSVAAGLLILTWVLTRRSSRSILCLLGMLLLAGYINAARDIAPPARQNHISHFSGKPALAVEARVVSVERRSMNGYRLVAEALRVFEASGTSTVYGKALLTIGEGDLQARPGQVIRWRSRLRRPAVFGNPGEFNYPLHLASQGVHVTGFIPTAEDLAVVINHPLRKRAVLDNLRIDLAESIRACVPQDQAGLLQSLLLGIKGGIRPEQRKTLAASGIAHLFAISGLHFGLLALLLYQGCKWLYSRSNRLILWSPPQRVLPILLMIPLAGYLVLTGNAWATRRAFLMVGMVALLILCGRRTTPFSLLACVALCILSCEPLALFQPGFQLSFAGVAGILAWLPGWRHRCEDVSPKIRWILMLLLSTLAATLGTAPVALWHFHLFAPAGLLSNLFAVPLIAWGAVPLGLTGMAIMPFAATSAGWLLSTAARIVDLVMAVADNISRLQWFTAIPVYMTPAKLTLLTGLLMAMLPLASVRRRAVCRAGVLFATILAATLLRIQSTEFQITALSVGQGDATLVSLPDNVHYLVDAGGLQGSEIDPGERLIAPALGRMGIDHLDGVILTHNHPDHTSGLAYIIERYPVEKFYLAASISELDPELRLALRRHRADVVKVDEGWSCIERDNRRELCIYVPDQAATDINERSIAVYARYLDQAAMLTADMGKAALRQLLAKGVPGKISLLKLPHHGSRLAAPGMFLEEFKPSLAFVSAGRDNPYNFPHKETIEACVQRQIPFYRTDQMGMLKFRVRDGKWQILHSPRKGFRID